MFLLITSQSTEVDRENIQTLGTDAKIFGSDQTFVFQEHGQGVHVAPVPFMKEE